MQCLGGGVNPFRARNDPRRQIRRSKTPAWLDDGISVSTAEPFATSKPVPHALRLALGSVALDRPDAALQSVRQHVQAQVDQ